MKPGVIDRFLVERKSTGDTRKLTLNYAKDIENVISKVSGFWTSCLEFDD